MRSNLSRCCEWLNTNYVIQAACLLLAIFFTDNSVLGVQTQAATKSLDDEIAEIFPQGDRWWYTEPLTLLLSKVSSERLLARKPMVMKAPANGKSYSFEETSRDVDGHVINEIRKRLDNDFKATVSTPNNPQGAKIPTIDRRRGLAILTQSMTTKPIHYQTLRTLPLMSDEEFEEMFPSIFACLGDKTRHIYGMISRCGNESSISTSEQAVAILQGEQAAGHEKEFVELLTDKQSCLRACGVEILSGHLPAFRRNGDRLLAMVHDEDAEVRDTVHRHLLLLTERIPEVVTALTANNSPTQSSLDSLNKILPACTTKDQNRIAAKLVDWMVQQPELCPYGSSNAPSNLFIKVIPELEKSELDNALDRLLTVFDQDEPAYVLLRIFSASGVRAKKVVPALQRSMSSTTGKTKIQVARTIYRVTGDASIVLPCYRAALESEDVSLHFDANAAAWKLGSDAAEIAPLLMSLLESNYSWTYARTLQYIGPPARDMLPRLEALYAATENPEAKKKLQSAIQAINGESQVTDNK